MIVVTDTSPLRYLILLGNEWLLPSRDRHDSY